MNTTPRFCNRFFLLLSGATLAAAGSLTIAVQLNDAVANWWHQTVIPLEKADAVWIYSLTLAISVLAIVMALGLVINQGGGTKKQVIRVSQDEQKPGTPGGVAVNVSLIQDMLEEIADRQPEVISVAVSCFESGKTRVLRIRAQLRKGASPAKIAGQIEDQLTDMDRRLGQHVPRVVELVSGIGTLWTRTRVAQ